MIWPFKSKNDKILDEIKIFEGNLNQGLVPLLQKPEKPVSGNGALMSMSVNMALHFLAIRSPKVFEQASVHVISYVVSAFGSMVAMASHGKVSVEDATNSILSEIQITQTYYSDALEKSPSSPEGALNKCLDIFLERSGGWDFKGEIERAQAITVLSLELQSLMTRYKAIL